MDLQKFLVMTILSLLWCGHAWWKSRSRKQVLERFITFWCGMVLYEIIMKWL